MSEKNMTQNANEIVTTNKSENKMAARVPTLEIKSVTKKFQDGKDTRTVLSDVSLAVYPGEFVVIYLMAYFIAQECG